MRNLRCSDVSFGTPSGMPLVLVGADEEGEMEEDAEEVPGREEEGEAGGGFCRACTSAMASRMMRMERTTLRKMTARQDARSLRKVCVGF